MPNTLTMRIRFQHIHVGRDTNIQYITTNREERGMLNELTVKDGLNIVLKRFKEYGMPNSVTPIIMIFVHVVDICMGKGWTIMFHIVNSCCLGGGQYLWLSLFKHSNNIWIVKNRHPLPWQRGKIKSKGGCGNRCWPFLRLLSRPESRPLREWNLPSVRQISLHLG